MTFQRTNPLFVMLAVAALAVAAALSSSPFQSGVVEAAAGDGICDRTPEVRNAILGKLPEVSDCADVTASDLSGITDALDLRGQGIESLQAHDFHGLANVKALILSRNNLGALPGDVFDGLSSLERLYLQFNDLTALPEGVFGGLSELKALNLRGNDLTALPEGVFDGLGNLERLFLKDNPGVAFTVTAELERQGDDAFVVKVAQGAPFDMAVTLSALGGSLSGTAVTIEGGSAASAPISVAPGSEGRTQVAISVESAAFVSYENHNGIRAGLGEPLTLLFGKGNMPATGLPSINGTVQVRQTLTADTSGISDADGLSGATFSYQWVRNDGSADTDIQGAIAATYALVSADAGRAIKVRATFTDDGGHAEALTSDATDGVLTAPPGPPLNLAVVAGNEELALSWEAPADDGGSPIQGYIVHWKSGAEEFDGSATSPRKGMMTDLTDLAYVIAGLTNGDAYTVRVLAYNENGDGSASDEVSATSCPGGPSPEVVEVEVEVGAVPIVVESTTADYFVLYVRHELNGRMVDVPVLVALGEDGTTTLSETVAALPKERYRVKKFLVADPADVDVDCIDDITELADPVGMNPVNPAAVVDPGDGAVAIPDLATFDRTSFDRLIKFIIVDAHTDRPEFYFPNTNRYTRHVDFLIAIGIDQSKPGLITGELAYWSDLFAPDGSRGLFTYEFRNAQSFRVVDYTLTALAASMPMVQDNMALYVRGSKYGTQHFTGYQRELASYEASRINIVFDEDIVRTGFFTSLNQGEGYGFLRVMDLEDHPDPRDVVIYEALPNELPRVAGIITTVPQTRLSHVNLRAVQDGVPNAYIGGTGRRFLNSFVGKYVRYEVTEGGYSIRLATRAEVDAHFESYRPAQGQTPQRDLSVTEIKPLSEIAFGDWDAFGVKAANVAVLGTFDFPEGTVPDGFAVPFYFYDEFMKHNDFYTRIQTMLADPDFQADLEVQQSKLKKLRKAIKKGKTPDWITTALTEMHEEFPEGTSLRYRSSTNNEDLPGFNGAGLYDSKTQHPDETEEDGISKSLKQVYASLWNFRAFTERAFHRIDHLAAAMGVLVHPNYSDEPANGVAVSYNPLREGNEDWYYVNTQVGEDLVTNPEALSVPEELLLHSSTGATQVVRTSNKKPPGQLIMSDDQMAQLGRHLAVIHREFKKLYDPGSDEPFAMEIEFKITSENALAIKQARPWVFGPDSDAKLRSLELSVAPLTFNPATKSYAASVAHDVGQTTVTATVNDKGASYVVERDGAVVEDGTVDLDVGENAISVVVTAADGKTSKTYTITVTRAPEGRPAVEVGLSATSAEQGSSITATLRFTNLARDADNATTDYIFRADVIAVLIPGFLHDHADSCEGDGLDTDLYIREVDEDPEIRTGAISEDRPPGDYTVEASISSPEGVELASASADFTVSALAGQEPPSTDATLSALTLSDAPFTFASDTISYDVNVANGVDQTTVTVTANDGEASYAIKLGGVSYDDGTIPLAVGENVITVEVTAEDYETTKTYTVIVTRAEAPLSTDARLSALTLSGVDIGAFDSANTQYAASVANDVAQTTVNPTTSDDGATYAIKLNGVADDGVIPLAVGENVITVEVTAEDGQTTKTYTVTVTRAEAALPVTVDLSPSGPVTEGTEIAVTMSFGGLTYDSDRSTTDYIFRADVVGADSCEGGGIGNKRYMYQVDDDPEVRTGAISAGCPVGDYKVGPAYRPPATSNWRRPPRASRSQPRWNRSHRPPATPG